jgi:hypothetical protein
MTGQEPLAWVVILGLWLPITMCTWTAAIVDAGSLRNPDDQPASFRLADKVTGASKEAGLIIGFRAPAFALALIFLNVVMVVSLVAGPAGMVGHAAGLTYFVVEGLWLRRIRSAIRRSRNA